MSYRASLADIGDVIAGMKTGEVVHAVLAP
jgi:hypothetical protein